MNVFSDCIFYNSLKDKKKTYRCGECDTCKWVGATKRKGVLERKPCWRTHCSLHWKTPQNKERKRMEKMQKSATSRCFLCPMECGGAESLLAHVFRDHREYGEEVVRQEPGDTVVGQITGRARPARTPKDLKGRVKRSRKDQSPSQVRRCKQCTWKGSPTSLFFHVLLLHNPVSFRLLFN